LFAPDRASLASDTTVSLEAREWSKKIDQNPENVDYLTQRAGVLSAEKRFDLAQLDYESAASLEPDVPSHQYMWGDALFADDKTSLALEHYKKAEDINPNDETAVFKHGQFLYFVRQFDKGKIKFGKLLQLNPQHAKGNFLTAMLNKEQGDTATAITYFKSTIKLLGSDYNSSMQLAEIYNAQGKDELAAGYYTNAINVDDASDEAYYARGLFYQKRGRTEEAMKDYQSTIDLNSGHFLAYYNAGNILAADGNYTKAIDHFEICLRLDEDFAKGYNRIAQCFELLKKNELAVQNYKNCLQIDPNFALAKDGLARLGEL
jgi:tetratricopeptide (TPR) repeat protein